MLGKRYIQIFTSVAILIIFLLLVTGYFDFLIQLFRFLLVYLLNIIDLVFYLILSAFSFLNIIIKILPSNFNELISSIIKLSPFLIIITPILIFRRFKLLTLHSNKLDTKKSESIFQKRLRKFKSIKRGYYSLIILLVLYATSLIGPLWMNNKPLYVSFSNQKYDFGEVFNDKNKNGVWDKGEPFEDQKSIFFPAIKDFFSFVPGLSEARYSASIFNQKGALVDFRKLNDSLNSAQNNRAGFIVMPLYMYHPHEDLSDKLDEKYKDANNNGKWDEGEDFNDENKNNEYDTFNPPTKPGDSKRNFLGTETSGKDVFARLVDGYKISITFALVVTTLSYIIGVIIGAFLGYFGGKWDLFGVRLIEIFSSIPFLFVLMILAGFMKPGVLLLALLSVILKGWIGITMYIRGEFFREKPKDYVSAAVSMGQSNTKIMFKHILPNSLTPIITFAPFSIIGDIFTLVSLDFLGYGLRPPASSWGALLKQGSENLLEWHLLVFPVLVLTITIFMITFISEAVREAFDPRVYSRLR